MELSFAFEKRLQKTYTSAASRQGGRATSADASHVSQHALLRLGQSRRYNFLLSQAAGFLIPNPKWVVSSAPDIFRAQFESQPSPGGCKSSGWVTVGLVFSREAQAGLQQRGATLEGFSPSGEQAGFGVTTLPWHPHCSAALQTFAEGHRACSPTQQPGDSPLVQQLGRLVLLTLPCMFPTAKGT